MNIEPINFSDVTHSTGQTAVNTAHFFGKKHNSDKSLEFNNNNERIVVLNRKYEVDVAPPLGGKHTYVNPHNHLYSYYHHDVYHGGHMQVGKTKIHFGDDPYRRHHYYDRGTRFLKINGDIRGDATNKTEVKLYSQKGYDRSFGFFPFGHSNSGMTETKVKIDSLDYAKLNIQNEHHTRTEVRGKGIYNNAKVLFDGQRHSEGKVKFDRGDNYTVDFYLRGKNSRGEFEDRAQVHERRVGGHIGDKFKMKAKNDASVALGRVTVNATGLSGEGKALAHVQADIEKTARYGEYLFENRQKGKQDDYATFKMNAKGENKYDIKGYYNTEIDDLDGKGAFKLESNKMNRGFVVGEKKHDNIIKLHSGSDESTRNVITLESSKGRIYREYIKGSVVGKGEKDTSESVVLDLTGNGKYLEFDGKGKSRSPQDRLAVNFDKTSNNYYVKAKNYEDVLVDLTPDSSYNTVAVDGAKKNNTTLTLLLGNKISKANDKNGGKHNFNESLGLYFPVRWHQNDALHMRDLNNNEIVINDHVTTVKVDSSWGKKNVTEWIKQESRIAERTRKVDLSKVKVEK